MVGCRVSAYIVILLANDYIFGANNCDITKYATSEGTKYRWRYGSWTATQDNVAHNLGYCAWLGRLVLVCHTYRNVRQLDKINLAMDQLVAASADCDYGCKCSYHYMVG